MVVRGVALSFALAVPLISQATGDTVSYAIAGKYFDAADAPIYKVADDGTIDWYTARGRDAYHATCHTCHGPRGIGSGYGVSLLAAVDTMSYFDFVDTTVNGQVIEADGAVRVMPAFGTTPNVTCSLDAIYIYLRAEAAGVLDEAASLVKGSPNNIAETELADCLRD